MKPHPTLTNMAAIQRTVTAALSMQHGRTHLPALQDIDRQLREHIAHLLPATDQTAGGLWRGSIEWSRHAAILDAIRDHARPLPASPLSALADIEQRARHCQWLLDQHAPPV